MRILVSLVSKTSTRALRSVCTRGPSVNPRRGVYLCIGKFTYSTKQGGPNWIAASQSKLDNAISSAKTSIDPKSVLSHKTPFLGNCLVTGSLGSVGYCVTSLLLSHPNLWKSLTCIDIKPEPHKLLHPQLCKTLDSLDSKDNKISYISSNITNEDEMKSLFMKHNFDTIFHIAGVIDLRAVVNLKRMWSVNVDATENLVKTLEERTGQSGDQKFAKFVYTSSIEAICGAEKDVYEGDESLPYLTKYAKKYGETKALAEQAVLRYNSVNSVSTCSLRLPNVFGPFDPTEIQVMIDSYDLIKKEKFVLLKSDEKKEMSHVYNLNAAYAHILAAYQMEYGNNRVGGQVFFIKDFDVNFGVLAENIYSDRIGLQPIKVDSKIPIALTTITDFIAKIRFKLFGKYTNVTAKAAAKNLKYNSTFSNKKAINELGYRPIVDIETSLENTSQSHKMFISNFELLKKWFRLYG